MHHLPLPPLPPVLLVAIRLDPLQVHRPPHNLAPQRLPVPAVGPLVDVGGA